jgi:hypothetical protein
MTFSTEPFRRHRMALTATEAADHLKVKPRTCSSGSGRAIRGYKQSGTKRHVWRFLRADLDAALLGDPGCPALSRKRGRFPRSSVGIGDDGVALVMCDEGGDG